MENSNLSRPNGHRVREFMVGSPVIAEWWHQLLHVRREMLLNSFSFIPLAPGDTAAGWSMIADHDLAMFCRGKASMDARRTSLQLSVQDAVEQGLRITPAKTVLPDAPAIDACADTNGRPVLVLDEHGRLRGILSPFDLL